MINLRNSPFLWIALALVLSFKIADIFTNPLSAAARLTLLGCCLLCAFLAIKKYAPRLQYLSSCVLAVLIMSAGLLRKTDHVNHIYPGTPLDTARYCAGVFRVSQVLKNKGNSVSVKCTPLAIYDVRAKIPIPDFDKYILISIRTTQPLIIMPDDTINGEGWFSLISPPLNPHAFDARSYYKTIGIRHQLYCKSEKITIDTSRGLSIKRMTAQWQFTLSSLVRDNISPQVAQLTNALVWGDRSDMDNDVRDAFADSGAMHVLSVSGMHVAIIFSMLLFVIGPPGAGGLNQRILKFICYSIAILLYTALTGACPAVVRAALMIILFLFGKCFSLSIQVWNLLGFAAFVMMWINPFIWENIGFQLSFLAMAGILLFAKPIIRSLSFKNTLLHHCWQITALSVAAQIFILPVLLGQFHQFPLTFILSSIVAIPAAYIVMAGALLNVLISLMGIDFLWPALDWSGKIFISCMKWMAELNPLMHYSLPVVSVHALMAMCILFSLAIVFRWPKGKAIAWAFGFMVVITLGCHRHRQWRSDEIIIYHSYKGLIMDVFTAGKCHAILSCSLDPATIEFTTRGHRCYKDIIGVDYICTAANRKTKDFKYENFSFQSTVQNFIILNEENVCHDLRTYDFIIIDQCFDSDEMLIDLIDPETTIILPAHLKKDGKAYLKEFLETHQLQFIDMETHGYVKLAL